MSSAIGYQWLAEEFGIRPVQDFPTISRIGKSRSTVIVDGRTTETLVESYRPDSTLASHLTFALKREGVHIEFLARLFHKLSPSDLQAWIDCEPSGRYARRACFLYEWLTGREIDFAGVTTGHYVDALPEEEYFTAFGTMNNPKWRVRNNLSGTRSFCPIVRRTPILQGFEDFDCLARLQSLETDFGTDVLLRSAVWLTIKESRASFQIEHEEDQKDRIRRFAAAIETWCGISANPLDLGFLETLQREILSEKALRKGIRKSPVFVGETALSREVVHYVAPHWDDIVPMLEGLHNFLTAMRPNRSTLVRAAVMSFGFVFIHPMADGNGRISRFLVNDTLRRDGQAPPPYILPVSSTIVRTIANRAAYDTALERFSKPLMNRYRSACRFAETVICEDGVRTDFHFDAYDDARFVWAYPDLTTQAEYMCGLIENTIEVEIRQEATFLLDLYRTRARIKEIFEGPDVEIDRIIRSIKLNGNVVSGKLARDFPILLEPGVGEAVVEAIVGPAQTDSK